MNECKTDKSECLVRSIKRRKKEEEEEFQLIKK